MTPQDYYGWTRCFALFRGLEEDPVIHAFYELLREPEPESYAKFVHALYETGQTNWTRYFTEQILSLETERVRLASQQKMIPAVMLTAPKTEPHALSEMALLSPAFFDIYGYKAGYTVEDDCRLYPKWLERVSSVSRYGFGDFARWHMFRLEPDESAPAGYRSAAGDQSGSGPAAGSGGLQGTAGRGAGKHPGTGAGCESRQYPAVR